MNFGNKKVLLIDDDNLNIKLTAKLLAKYDIIPDTGNNALELFQYVKTRDYDLILLDDMMPVMYGEVAMQRLREQGYNKPIVVLTGNTEHDSPREHYMEVGFNDYLQKPLNEKLLVEILQKFLK